MFLGNNKNKVYPKAYQFTIRIVTAYKFSKIIKNTITSP